VPLVSLLFVGKIKIIKISGPVLRGPRGPV
jgi:hypothetical protein